MSLHTNHTTLSEHFSDNPTVELLKSSTQYSELTQHKVKLVSTESLSDEIKSKIITTIMQWQSNVTEEYLQYRLTKYNTLLLSQYDGEYSCVFFINSFTRNNSCYLHIGPVFSPSYISFGLTVCYLLDHYSKDFTSLKIIAEVENPEIILYWYSIMPLLKTFPKINSQEIPDSVIVDVKLFSENIKHIPNIDYIHFKTNSTDSLYKRKASHRPILNWLNQKGIFPEDGDSQLLFSEINTHDLPEIVYKAITYINTYPAKRQEFMALLTDTQQALSSC